MLFFFLLNLISSEALHFICKVFPIILKTHLFFCIPQLYYTDVSNDNVRNSSNEAITMVLKEEFAFNKMDSFSHNLLKWN